MERRSTSSIRPASCERGGVMHKTRPFRPLGETLKEIRVALDAPTDLHATLVEAAFDMLGAARWIKGRNESFARAAVASALKELQVVADRLGVRQ